MFNQNRQKNRHKLVFMLTTLLMVMSSSQATSNLENLISNPGAEIGVAPWTSFGGGPALQATSDQVHSGTKSFLISQRTQFYHGPAYEIKSLIVNGQLVNSERYNVSVWVRQSTSSNQNLHLNIKQTDGSGTKYNTIDSQIVPPNEWVKISGFYTPNITGTLSALTLYITSDSGTTFDFSTDDFFLGNVENYTPPTSSNPLDFIHAGGTNLLLNDEPIVLKGLNISVPTDASDKSNDIWNTKAISATDFQNIKDMGFNSIRLAMNYKVFEDDNAVGIFKEDGWHWLDRAISYAKDAGLYVMLDMHAPQGGYQSDKSEGFSAFWDGSGTQPNTSNQNRLIALWKAIASRYKNEPTILGYDLINEPRSHNSKEWYTYAEQIVTEIRKADTNHMIVLETPFISNSTFQTINDNNVLYDSHFYEPWSYTIQYSVAYNKAGQRWGKYDSTDNPMGASFNKEYLTKRLQEDLLDFTTKYNVPANVGEYGVVHEAFYNDVNAKEWMTDIHDIFDGYNTQSVPVNRFYFNYQGNTFGLYTNWSGFPTSEAMVNTILKNYWIEYLSNNTTLDVIPPILKLVGEENITIEQGNSYIDAGATANDNLDGDISETIITTGTVDSNTIGLYQINYTVEDSTGNIAIPLTRTVNVVKKNIDTIPPVLRLNGEVNMTLIVGDNYTDAGATAIDNIDGNITDNIVTLGEVDTTTVGTYNINYDVSDTAGNMAIPIKRTIKVEAKPIENIPSATTNNEDTDLLVTITKQNTARVGKALGLRIITKNKGRVPANNVETVFEIPENAEFIVASDACTYNPVWDEVHCNWEQLPKKAQRTANIYIRPLKKEFMEVHTNVEADNDDPNDSNNEATLRFKVK